MNHSEQINELAAALAKATLEFKPILRNKTVSVRMKSGGQYTFAYAPMETILEATKPALAKHGISALQNLREGYLVTLLIHSSGQFVELAPILIPATDGTPQALGSILTYCSRYSYKTALNLATDDDDDGGAAAGNETTTVKAPQTREVPERLLTQAREMAMLGTADYKAFYSMLTGDQRTQLMPEHENLKKAAAQVDKSAAKALAE